MTAVVVGLGTIAFACVPSSNFWAEPDFGPPGAITRMHGQGFAGPEVELRWGTPEGPLLAKATSGDFTLDVTIPAVADGVYVVYALKPEAGTDSLPASRIWNRMGFEVTASNVRGTWLGNTYGGRPPEPVTAPAAQPAPSEPAAQPAPSEPEVTAAPAAQPAPTATATPQRAPARATTSARRTSTPEPAPAASTPAPSAPVATTPAPVVPAQPEVSSAPEPSTSIGTPARTRPATSSDGAGGDMGLILFSIGLVVLFGGFTAAALGRRRATVRSRTGGRD